MLQNTIEKIEEAIIQDEPLHRSRWVWMGGILAFGLALFGYATIGQIYSDWQAIRLLEAVNPSVQTLCFAAITASSTILALMLTMIALLHQSEVHFEATFFGRIRQIALLCSVVITLATLLLAFINTPVNDAEILPPNGLKTIFYGVIFVSAFLSGLLITIIMMLYETLNTIIKILAPQS